MLKNYLKIALRNLIRHKSNTIINMVGLSVGMACCILIAMYAKEELSYDRFHEKADRIVAIGTGDRPSGGSNITPYPLADAMEQGFPEVERATRMDEARTLRLSRNQENFFEIKNGKYAEHDFFDVFSFPLLYGNQEKVLDAPNQLVLTLGTSKKLFGDQNPVGESLYWEKRDTTLIMEITGVVDKIPGNSSLKFGALVSSNTRDLKGVYFESWRVNAHQTYALLNSPDAINQPV